MESAGANDGVFRQRFPINSENSSACRRRPAIRRRCKTLACGRATQNLACALPASRHIVVTTSEVHAGATQQDQYWRQ